MIELQAKQATQLHQIKTQEEISAALRSLQTNLSVICLGIITSSCTKLLPSQHQTAFNLITNSLQKVILPIATTLANFGKVRSVTKAFYDYFRSPN